MREETREAQLAWVNLHLLSGWHQHLPINSILACGLLYLVMGVDTKPQPDHGIPLKFFQHLWECTYITIANEVFLETQATLLACFLLSPHSHSFQSCSLNTPSSPLGPYTRCLPCKEALLSLFT
jgi:hypothetical protein